MLAGQLMNRFGRQQHDLPAFIHGKQKTRAWFFSLMWADLTITGDKNPWILVRFVSTELQWDLQFVEFLMTVILVCVR